MGDTTRLHDNGDAEGDGWHNNGNKWHDNGKGKHNDGRHTCGTTTATGGMAMLQNEGDG
jgi:hypothetical protein